MKLDELKNVVEEGAKKGELRFVCRFSDSKTLDISVYSATKRIPSEYEYLILLPIIDRVGFREQGVWNVYGKIKD